MGTVNYKTSSRVCTVGYDTDTSGYDIEELMQEYQCTRENAEERAAELEEFDIEETYQNCKYYISELPKMEHYSVAIEHGYYEGFCILVTLDCDILGHYDKRLINKELTQIKALLKKCIEEQGLRVCTPSWCTDWKHTLKESLDALDEAVKKERENIKKLKDV